MINYMANMTPNELVSKILSGERDFAKLILPDMADLREFIPRLNEYLKSQELQKQPLLLNNSKLYGLIAPLIFMPYSIMSGADMSRADMYRANMYRANMSEADMSGANMSGANMSGADMSEANMSRADMSRADMSRADMSEANMYRADMSGADMSRADMSEADMSEANMSRADIRGVIGLELCYSLDNALFNQTIVTENEKRIIEKAREKLQLFDVREN